MPFRLAIFLTLCIVGAPRADAQALHWRSLSQAFAAEQPVVVFVRAPWCGPCRQLERETFTDPAIAERLARFSLTRLTIDDHDRMHRVGPYRLSEADWAARLGAERTPTLILLSPDGAILGRQTGWLPPSLLAPILDAALASSL